MLTLPTDTRKPGYTDEIEPDALVSFEKSPWFIVENDGAKLRFRANCGGVTTRTSGYPRSELREWDTKTNTRAAWSTTSGRHEMMFVARIIAVPAKKRHVICGQIHDADDDILMVRLEDTKLFIERNDVERVMLTRKYQLGDLIDIRIVVADGHISLWYAGDQVMDWELSRDGCYFKAGCYTQSNVKRGDAPDDYAEVLIEKLDVSH